ncbi:MAG: DUF4369 domain-containing protein, partial [Muribaculaceae bacterium]
NFAYMKGIISIIVAMVALGVASCGKNADEGYSVVCRLDAGVQADSVTIYEYSTEYGAARVLAKHCVDARNRSLTITGHTDRPAVAFIRIGNNFMSRCTYFILENGKTDIRIGNGYVNIEGARLNREYFRAFAERWGMVNRQKSLRKNYDLMVKNGAITDSIDREFELAHKQCCDSLQRLYARTLSLDPVVAQTFWCQFGNEMNLTPELESKLKRDSLLYKFIAK